MFKIMEIFNLITAILLVMIALSSTRILILFKILLSSISGYFIIKLFFFPDIRLWNVDEYSIVNVQSYVKNGMFFYSVLSCLGSYFLIYFILNMTLIYVLKNKIPDFYHNYLKRFSFKEDRNARSFVIKFAKKVFRFINSVKGDIDNINVKKITYEIMRVDLCRNLCLILHIVICCLLLNIDSYLIRLIIYIAIFYILIMFVFIIPATNYLFDLIKFVINHESNRDS